MDGYTCCTKIIQLCNQKTECINPVEELRQLKFLDWIKNLINKMNEEQEDLSSLNSNDNFQTVDKYRAIYERIKYYSLDQQRIPFIFAYSALVNSEVKTRTKETGFNDCLEAPLTEEIFMRQVVAAMEEQIFWYLSEELSDIEQTSLELLHMK